MRRLPPRSTRTDTLFPYTTLFRSIAQPGGDDQAEDHRPHRAAQQAVRIGHVIEIERHHHGCTGLDPHLLNPQDCERERSEEHTSELQSLMRISYAVFCLKKKKKKTHTDIQKKRTTINRHTES